MAWKFGMGFFLVLNFVREIFWGFVGSPRDAPI